MVNRKTQKNLIMQQIEITIKPLRVPFLFEYHPAKNPGIISSSVEMMVLNINNGCKFCEPLDGSIIMMPV